MRPAVIVTWDFGLQACEEAISAMKSGVNALDAVERGIRLVEDDTSVDSVGYGGAPNSEGIVELDAAVMWGPDRSFGAVAGLRDIREAVSVARLVMEQTPHSLLVGEGALQFAIEKGFTRKKMLTDKSLAEWEKWKQDGACKESHDTVCVLALDLDGNICVGTSTSGTRFKLPGRVGDTPIIGSGFYCDNEVGAAAATGLGESIMRYSMSFRIVEEMRRGIDPTSACRSTLEWALKDDPSLRKNVIGLIALNASGQRGAAACQDGFSVASGDDEHIGLVKIEPVLCPNL
ncbi:MAG: N(4)-(beta-N-acetylglucosaminyl)-L-asparaginase [Armatimonadota bacterium]|nr:N(4)-(beta-N-acetylglucosaminyl)-L-asparaginase [bacterium]